MTNNEQLLNSERQIVMTLQTSLKDSICTFLAQPHLKAGTIKAYKQAIIPMCDYIGPARPPSEVSPLELQRFWNKFTDPSKEYAPSTKRKHYRSLKAFFNWLVDMQLIEKSPFSGIKAPKVPDYDTREKAMTDDEYEIILNYVRHKSQRDYTLIIFMGDTGVRAIGASRLKVSDVNLIDCSAKVRGKGGKVRKVFYGERCAFALKEWMRQKPTDSGEYLFRQRFGTLDSEDRPMSPDHISHIIRDAAKDAGIDRTLGSHSIRHRLGHRLADSGTPITISKKVLGHARISSTQIYYPNDDQRARLKSNELSTGAKSHIQKLFVKIATFMVNLTD
jgi:site-specific recombinase XerD